MSRPTVVLTSEQLLQRVIHVAQLLCATSECDPGSKHQSGLNDDPIIPERVAGELPAPTETVRFEVK
jgi:hypothetical protein